MIINPSQNNSIFFSKVKEKNFSSDEFQASINEIKNKEKDDAKEEKEVLQNQDIDLSSVKNNFGVYAWQKMREDQYKKNEETILNKLFAAIDQANQAK
ncbi:hypothetical protein JG677_05905 [Campylobacter sp. TTU-622]|uniref:hypothetical protein n=1 Tax=unclassified Campylobacter TaxID=2593542 RepID=UPI0019045507|nr:MULTISPECIES: hypothetical protein [unclassified Campylobacter]MBK1971433.1 hypothetical protein [Campylobacter sp. TTU_617]MBK1973585.1 hypothetical protein [Campylobacter sp. TTU-622]